MTENQIEARQERAGNGALVVSRVEEGYRVYSVSHPSHLYLVRQEGERWTCTCPDFEYHQGDTTWRCKHILAVAPWKQQESPEPYEPGNGEGETIPVSPEPSEPAALSRKRTPKHTNGFAQMLIKRSISPDGRIDSVSVEFSMPVAEIAANGEIKAKALNTLRLQKEIVADFLKLNGSKPSAFPPPASKPPEPVPENGQPVFARLIDIGKVNGKWGERLTLNVQINGRTSRLFGSAKQLAERIQAAGYEIDPANLEPGLRLNLACRVTTKPSDDGKYLNVEKVLPLGKNANPGGGYDSSIPY
ncbi:MAG: SWIM zinc finger domain-containing protein [Acidobacteria bacterium]|nr:SWIM zinc finger domain-containing protein [Acidobacteriota bacterium]